MRPPEEILRHCVHSSVPFGVAGRLTARIISRSPLERKMANRGNASSIYSDPPEGTDPSGAIRGDRPFSNPRTLPRGQALRNPRGQTLQGHSRGGQALHSRGDRPFEAVRTCEGTGPSARGPFLLPSRGQTLQAIRGDRPFSAVRTCEGTGPSARGQALRSCADMRGDRPFGEGTGPSAAWRETILRHI